MPASAGRKTYWPRRGGHGAWQPRLPLSASGMICVGCMHTHMDTQYDIQHVRQEKDRTDILDNLLKGIISIRAQATFHPP